MKCIEEGCKDKATTGWLKCPKHVWEVPEEKKTMTTEETATREGFCEVRWCNAKTRDKGDALCEIHKTEYRASPIMNCQEWIEGMNRIPAVPAIAPKHNEGKRRFSLVRREFIRAIADVMTWGLTKYPAENYLSLDSTTIYDSMMRHLDDHLSGKKIDEESGKPHLHHFASNAMMFFMLEYRKDEGK